MLHRRARSWLLCLALVPSAGMAAEIEDRDPSEDRYDSAGGVTVGLPQIIALTAEKEISPHLRLQGNLGTAVGVSSACGRMIAVADAFMLQPYGFLGGGLFTVLVASEVPVVPYGWYGVGLRLEVDRVILFAEAGSVVIAGSDGGGSGVTPGVGAVGLLVEY